MSTLHEELSKMDEFVWLVVVLPITPVIYALTEGGEQHQQQEGL